MDTQAAIEAALWQYLALPHGDSDVVKRTASDISRLRGPALMIDNVNSDILKLLINLGQPDNLSEREEAATVIMRIANADRS